MAGLKCQQHLPSASFRYRNCSRHYLDAKFTFSSTSESMHAAPVAPVLCVVGGRMGDGSLLYVRTSVRPFRVRLLFFPICPTYTILFLYTTYENVCQMWDSNPRPHSWTRTLKLNSCFQPRGNLESGALDRSANLTATGTGC